MTKSIKQLLMFAAILLLSMAYILSSKLLMLVVLITLFLYLMLLEENKYAYIISLGLIACSAIIIPWTKKEFRIGPIQAAYLVYVLTFLIYFLSLLIKKQKLYKINLGNKQVNYSLILFLFYITVSVVWVYDYSSWGVHLIQWYLYILFCCYMSNLFDDNSNLIKFLVFHSYCLAIISNFGVMRYLLLSYPDGNPILILNRNASLFILMPFIPITFSLKEYFKNRIFFYYVLASQVTCALLIFSRTGYLALLLNLFLLGALNMKKFNPKRLTKGVIILIVLAILIYTFISFIDPLIIERLINRFLSISDSIKIFGNSEEIQYDWRRVNLVRGGIEIFKAKPILGTGLGLNNYLYYFPDNIYVGVPARAHNFYISYLAELGLIGFSAIILFFITAGIHFYKQSIKINDGTRIIGEAFFIGHVMILIALGFNEYITSPNVWFFWGLGFNFFKNYKK